jgi:hypothetical protein
MVLLKSESTFSDAWSQPKLRKRARNCTASDEAAPF